MTDVIENTSINIATSGMSREEVMESMNASVVAVVNDLHKVGKSILSEGDLSLSKILIEIPDCEISIPRKNPNYDYMAKMERDNATIQIVPKEDQDNILGNIQNVATKLKSFLMDVVIPNAIGSQIALDDVNDELKIILGEDSLDLNFDPLKYMFNNAITLRTYEYLTTDLGLSPENAEMITSHYFTKSLPAPTSEVMQMFKEISKNSRASKSKGLTPGQQAGFIGGIR